MSWDSKNIDPVQVPMDDSSRFGEAALNHGHPTTGILGGSFLLCATTLGAGILAIPFAFGILGIGVGAPLLLLVGLMSVASLWMMIQAGDASGARSYEEMAHLAAPRFGRVLVVIFMDVLIFGALTGFLVIIGDLIRPIIDHWTFPLRAWYIDTPYLILAFTVVFVFPLCMLRNISKLEYTSFLAVGIIIVFTGILTYQAIEKMVNGKVNWSQLTWYPSGQGEDFSSILNRIFNALPIIALAYTCQLSVFPIWQELERPTVTRMNIVNNITMGISYVLYTIMGFFAYILYPTNTPSNIILSLDYKDTLNTSLRIIFLVAILFHYPVVHFALRNSLEITIFKNFEFSWIRHTIITILVVGASLACAVLPINLGQVFNLTGSVAAFPINFIVPSYCFIVLKYFTKQAVNEEDPDHPDNKMLLLNPDGSYQKPKVNCKSLCRPGVIIPLLIIFISLIFMVLGIYVSIIAFIPEDKHPKKHSLSF